MMIGFFLIYLIEELVHNYLHRHQHKKLKEKNAKSLKDDPFTRGLDVRNSALMRASMRDFPDHQNSVSDLIARDQTDSVGRKDPEAHANGHGHSHVLPLPHSEEEDMLVSSLRGLLIVLALSIHELFEGFAVGLEKTSASKLFSDNCRCSIEHDSFPGVYFMFAAVSAHKFVISFCIGVELMVQNTKLWLAFVYVVIYSLVSAIGKRR